MALKDIFTMIKADRYTTDGCEEIKKAQEAIAEDAGLPDGTMRHRKDGDYIKQGGKWKPAPAGKAPGVKTSPETTPKAAGSKPAEKLPAIPTRGMSKSYIRGTQLMKPADSEKQRGEQHWAGVLSGYSDTSVIEQRKKLQETYDEFEDDIKDYDRRKLAPAVYAKRINQQNFLKGALKAIDDEIESRGLDPMPNFSTPRDSAPRVLTGDCKIRIRKSK